jgi:PAS domain S-box-containing protein
VIERNYRRAMGEGVTVEFEEFYPPHDRWYENHLYPAKDGISVYFRDVTDRKRAEADRDRLIERVDEERRHLQALIESSPDCIKELDLGGRLVAVSEKGRKLLEIRDLCDFLDKPWLDFWPGEGRGEAERALSRAMAGGVGSFEGFCPTAAGTPRWWDVVVTPILDHGGRPHRLLCVSRDVTDRRRHREERERLLAEAQGANRAKDQFLAVLSHELRTPLNPILLAATSMLDHPCDPEEVRPTLEMIRQNVNLQARLIDDLLDVMRIVQGKMPLHWEVADCHRIIGQAIEICRSEFSGHDLRLSVEAVARHHHVNADAARLQQVFWNLIKNAVKFTPEGGAITVRTRNEGGDGEDRIVVEVSDTGIGIEPEVLPTIFDPFQQGETTITRKFGGLGLGLAICKGVVEAHGGILEAESPGKGRGTTFRVALKALPEEAVGGNGQHQGDGLSVASHRPSSLRILVVEDEPATLRLMARLLRGLGHVVTTAGTIASGHEAFESGEFDLIVSDIGLPDGTGLELMRRVVALRGRVPAIALTGYGMEEDIQKSRESGFTAHMTKPIDFTKLEAMIRQVAT